MSRIPRKGACAETRHTGTAVSEGEELAGQRPSPTRLSHTQTHAHTAIDMHTNTTYVYTHHTHTSKYANTHKHTYKYAYT